MSDKFDSDKAFEKVLVSSLEAELMPQSRGCPHLGTLSAYYEGTLTESETADCEHHLSSCAACQKQLAALARLDPKGPEPLPEPAARAPGWRWRWTASTALAATAVLAIVVTYRFRQQIEQASRMAVQSREPSEKLRSPLASPPPAPLTAGTEEQRTAKDAELAEASRPAVSEDGSVDRAASTRREAAAPLGDSAVAPTAPLPTQAPAATPEPAKPASSPVGAVQAMPRLAPQAPTEAEPFQTKKAERSLSRAKEPARGASATSRLRDDSAGTAAGRPMIVVARSNQDVLWRLDGSRIERSDDAGMSWRPQTSGASAALTAGSAPSPEVSWVVGRSGTVLRTTDGRRWEKVSPPTKEDLVKVTAFGASEATVTSSSGQRFSTGDGGKTWSVR